MNVTMPTYNIDGDGLLYCIYTAKVADYLNLYPFSWYERWRLDNPNTKPSGNHIHVNGKSWSSLTEYDGVLVHLNFGDGGSLTANISGCSEIAVMKRIAQLREEFPIEQVSVGRTVPVIFWTQTPRGPNSYRRDLEVPTWDEVRDNYESSTHGLLATMMDWRSSVLGGKLVLWYGVPGTGKTWALRALASEWRQWCSFEYVTDPDEMFHDGSYLTHAILNDASTDRWRCLILEDTGELLSADAKERQGQSLSRLLNTVDGFLGQGLKIMFLITTNEELKSLHPAVTRPGRCLYRVPFEKLSHLEANSWLAGRSEDGSWSPKEATIAELFQHVEKFPLPAEKPAVEPGQYL